MSNYDIAIIILQSLINGAGFFIIIRMIDDLSLEKIFFLFLAIILVQIRIN